MKNKNQKNPRIGITEFYFIVNQPFFSIKKRLMGRKIFWNFFDEDKSKITGKVISKTNYYKFLFKKPDLHLANAKCKFFNWRVSKILAIPLGLPVFFFVS